MLTGSVPAVIGLQAATLHAGIGECWPDDRCSVILEPLRPQVALGPATGIQPVLEPVRICYAMAGRADHGYPLKQVFTFDAAKKHIIYLPLHAFALPLPPALACNKYRFLHVRLEWLRNPSAQR